MTVQTGWCDLFSLPPVQSSLVFAGIKLAGWTVNSTCSHTSTCSRADSGQRGRPAQKEAGPHLPWAPVLGHCGEKESIHCPLLFEPPHQLPDPCRRPRCTPNWRPTRTGQLSMRSHACPCLLSMFTWLKFAAFEKVFLRVAPCRILRGTLTGIRQTLPPSPAQAGTPRERQWGDWTPQKNSG